MGAFTSSDAGVAHADQHILRAAVAAYLGRYRGQTRLHTESDLRVFLRWDQLPEHLIAARSLLEPQHPVRSRQWRMIAGSAALHARQAGGAHHPLRGAPTGTETG